MDLLHPVNRFRDANEHHINLYVETLICNNVICVITTLAMSYMSL